MPPGGQDRIPHHHRRLRPPRHQPEHEARRLRVLGLHLVGRIDQHQPIARLHGREGQHAIEPVAPVDRHAVPAHRRAEGGVLGGMQLHQHHAVLRPQQRSGDQRRAGIGGRPVAQAGRRQRRSERRRGIGIDPPDAPRRLAGCRSFRAVEAIEPAPGVGLGIGDASRLDRQPRDELGQHDMLVKVGRAAGMIGVLIGKHRMDDAPDLFDGERTGAVEKTRTSTGVTPQRPQRCASTNSATTALARLLAKPPGLYKARRARIIRFENPA